MTAEIDARAAWVKALEASESRELPRRLRDRAATARHPLWVTRGVIISAHMSGDVVGWRGALARQLVDNAERWLAGQPLFNVADKRLGFAASVEPFGREETA